MRCCGSSYQTITVNADAGGLRLLRCAHCETQCWARDGVLIERDAAFALLASAYRQVPLQARAARDRAAAASAARQAARLAQKAQQNSPSIDVRDPEHQALRDLLSGWQVLGAAS